MSKVKIGDVCNILNGFAFKSERYVNEGIRVVRITNVQKGYIEDEKPQFYPATEMENIKDYILQENDLLLSLTGNVGRVAMLDKSFLPAALNQRVACLRIKDSDIILKYLYYALLSNRFENDCISSAKGIAQKNMSTEWLKGYEIYIYSKEKQTCSTKLANSFENGVPTYGYDLAQAVTDGYLVDYMSVETKLKFIEEGIVYDELSDEDKLEYENTFKDENGELPDSINSSALNEWIFNKDTICEVLNVLMTHGIKIDYGQKIGKTIIFAKNHRHAEAICEVFYQQYPHLVDYAKVIDNHINYAQSAIDEFSDPKKLPQIAISVDMLDTGIDVPEVVNLVFFKKVMSKAKFWQMIGRGTRLCPELLDGKDKEKFYIFDFCGNFEFFRLNSKGNETPNQLPLQGAIFNLKTQIVYKLQDLEYQTEELIAFRNSLVEDLVGKVRELNKENFAVRQHLRYVELFSNPDNYKALTYENTFQMDEEIAPLVIADGDDAKAVRFDALMYGIELAYLVLYLRIL